MDYQEKVECVRAGLGHEPTEQEISYWLYGPRGRAMTEAEQVAFVETALKGSPGDWQVKVFRLILQVPKGSLISYGNLARWANKEYGLQIVSQNAALVRKNIYYAVMHDTDIPIHRVATQRDTQSKKDHPVTQEFNRRKRAAEGSLLSPHWFVP